MTTKFRFLLEGKQSLSLGDFDMPKTYIQSVKETSWNDTKYLVF